MADRIRAAPARKRSGARRPARRKRRRLLRILALAALAALILGFLARRVMIPSAVHYIAYRPPNQSESKSGTNQPAAPEADGDAASDMKSNGTGAEQLTPGDRGELDAIIKRKGR